MKANEAQVQRNTYNTPWDIRLADEDFRFLQQFVETRLGIKMPHAKKTMLETRIMKRLRALHLSDYKSYLKFAFSGGEGDAELIQLMDVITTNKTDFFREPDHFEMLERRILPDLQRIIERGGPSELSVWSAGCSSGEEVYTLAMVLENYREAHEGPPFSILGTDLSTAVLRIAETGIYTEHKIEPIPMEYRKKYLLRSKNPVDKIVKFRRELRARVHFIRLNFMDENWSLGKKYHIIFCRNVMIYFNRETQRRLVSRFYEHLLPHGYLFVGHSETLTSLNVPFKQLAPTIYQR